MYVKNYEKTNRNIILLDDSSISNIKMNLDEANALVEEIVLDETSSDSAISLIEEIIVPLDSDISLDGEIISDSKMSIDSETIISDSEISIDSDIIMISDSDISTSGSEIPSDSETLIQEIFSTSSDLEYCSENIKSEVFATDKTISSENDFVSDKEIVTNEKIVPDEETMLDAESLFETILNDFNQLDDYSTQVYKSLIDRLHHPLAVISYLLENERMLCNKELILSENANPRIVNYINSHYEKMSKFYGDHKNDSSSEPITPSPCSTPLNFDRNSVPLLSQNLLDDDSTITSFDSNTSANCVSQDQNNVSPPKCSTVTLSATSKVFKHSSHNPRKSLPSTSIGSTLKAPCVHQPSPSFQLPTAVRSKPFIQIRPLNPYLFQS